MKDVNEFVIMKKVQCLPRPKMEIVIDNGIFDCFVSLFVKLGLCHQKERVQSEHPDANVRYSFELSKEEHTKENDVSHEITQLYNRPILPWSIHGKDSNN